MIARVKLLRPRVGPPSRGTFGASGYDLSYAGEERVQVEPGQVVPIPTGIALQIPSGYEGQIRSRSGNTYSVGLVVANQPGTIDADYRGEVFALMTVIKPDPVLIYPGNRVAQLVFAPVSRPELQIVDELDDSERGGYGFGSTGR